MEIAMRKLISAMRLSADQKFEGPEGYADWVEAWADDYNLTPQIDACVVGGGMYPGYEKYWTTIQEQPEEPHWMSNRRPTPAEIDWARFAAQTPHYVVSSSLTSAQWPQTRFVRTFDEIAALKQQQGKDIYLMGGARLTSSLLDAGLVDELRLILYPVISGAGKALFGTLQGRHGLELRSVQQLPGGRVSLIYGLADGWIQ
jgi:dihydrofolate reductase